MRESLSRTLASLPARFHEERAELLAILRASAILHASPTQPVLSRDGSSARWMLNTLAVSLTARGAELAGRCLLALLDRFEGRQIATYGLTAIPLLQACLLEGRGRYRGVIVRKERKKHGSCRLIEGPLDPSEPVVLVDDSISSGISFEEGRRALEAAGCRVEGGVSLVRFGWYGGFARAQELGYHVASVYDIWDDFIAHMEGETRPAANPTKVAPPFAWSEARAPEGLHPAELARAVIDEYLASQRLLRPPARLDGAYDSAGGAWVSVRSKDDVYLRHARDGLWHFPGEPRGAAPEDLVTAALHTAARLPGGAAGRELLARSAIAVTFFSALEACPVAGLDNDRYGIVVRSLERPWKMGGALPRMPGIAGEWQQHEHARRNNAGLVSFEPYVIYRHDVTKVVEPGAAWQPTGVPRPRGRRWDEDPAIGGRLAERARDLVLSRLTGAAPATAELPGDLAPQIDTLFVTVYLDGRLRGCMGSRAPGIPGSSPLSAPLRSEPLPGEGLGWGLRRPARDLDADLGELCRLALDDGRFAAGATGQGAPARVAVTVSLLSSPLELGQFSPAEVAARTRHGEQALLVHQGGRSGLLLPFVATMDDLDPLAYALEVIDKAGITRPPYRWRRYDCATWLADGAPARRLRGLFPPGEPPASLEAALARLTPLFVRYLLGQVRDDGTLYVRYRPVRNVLHEGLDAPRLAHAAWVLSRAHRALGEPAAGGRSLGDAARAVVGRLASAVADDDAGRPWVVLGGEAPTIAEVSFLLLALLERPAGEGRETLAPRLAETLWSSVDAHGRFATHRPPAESHEGFQDYSPGQALLALAAAAAAGLAPAPARRARRALSFYVHRSRHKRGFGQVSWLMQAFTAWSRLLGEPSLGEAALELGDFALGYQQETTGAFVNDHQADTPGYTTAVYLEGIAAGVSAAAALGDEARRARYLDACARGFRFLDGLVIQERDAAVLPAPSIAIGGLRQSAHRSEIRVDFVQHALAAALEARDRLGAPLTMGPQAAPNPGALRVP